MYNEIEKIFNNEVRDKKRTARGCYAMKGKRGIIKKMVTPVDFMTKKEKKEYISGGEIQVTNMYNDITQIPHIQDLREKAKTDKAGAKKTMDIILNYHQPSKLQKHWEISNYSYYKYLRELGFDFKFGQSTTRSTKRSTTVSTTKAAANKKPAGIEPTEIIKAQQNLYNEALMFQQIQNQQNIINPVKEAEENDLFRMKYSKAEVNGDIAADRITTLLSVLNYKKNYKISLVIEELNDPENPVE